MTQAVLSHRAPGPSTTTAPPVPPHQQQQPWRHHTATHDPYCHQRVKFHKCLLALGASRARSARSLSAGHKWHVPGFDTALQPSRLGWGCMPAPKGSHSHLLKASCAYKQTSLSGRWTSVVPEEPSNKSQMQNLLQRNTAERPQSSGTSLRQAARHPTCVLPASTHTSRWKRVFIHLYHCLPAISPCARGRAVRSVSASRQPANTTPPGAVLAVKV